jgi:hypothetical protein
MDEKLQALKVRIESYEQKPIPPELQGIFNVMKRALANVEKAKGPEETKRVLEEEMVNLVQNLQTMHIMLEEKPWEKQEGK